MVPLRYCILTFGKVKFLASPQHLGVGAAKDWVRVVLGVRQLLNAKPFAIYPSPATVDSLGTSERCHQPG